MNKDTSINRQISVSIAMLWLALVLIAMMTVLGWLGTLLGYAFGIVAAIVVALGHLVLGRYVKRKRKNKALVVFPVGLALLSPVVYILVKFVISGSASWASLKLLAPFLFGSLLPALLLYLVIRKLHSIQRRLL